ncbi:MAG: hypothetical protein VKJ04_07865 [Vampirovibrionales bacterium]|nr:hypothetical protein [Vampirovibrionales bacterium]
MYIPSLSFAGEVIPITRRPKPRPKPQPQPQPGGGDAALMFGASDTFVSFGRRPQGEPHRPGDPQEPRRPRDPDRPSRH